VVLAGAAAGLGTGAGIWFVDVTTGVGIVGLEIKRGNVEITVGFDIVGRKIELSLTPSVNEAIPLDVTPFGVLVIAVVGAVGILVGIPVGIVGILAGIDGMLVGIIGIGLMTGGGFISGDMPPIDRSARPSSCSTEIDAFRRDRRPFARCRLGSSCGFIVVSPVVTEIISIPT
jgi:hypothetical protein